MALPLLVNGQMVSRAFFAVRESVVGPDRRFAAAQQDVGNGGQTGRSADEARTDAFDRVLTSTPSVEFKDSACRF